MFRDREFFKKKWHQTVRAIAVLGSTFLTGYQIDKEHAFPKKRQSKSKKLGLLDMSFLRTQRLAVQYIGLSCLFGSLLTLALTSVDLVIYYNGAGERLQQTAHRIDKTYSTSLANSVWIMDERQIKTILKNLIRYENFQYAELHTDAIHWSRGDKNSDPLLEHKSSLSYVVDNDKIDIGVLLLQSNNSAIYRDLAAYGIQQLGFHSIRAMLMVAFSMHLYYFLIGRNLTRISEHISQARISKTTQILSLRRSENASFNELDDIADAINHYDRELKRTNLNLSDQNLYLEIEIQKRTEELESAMRANIEHERLAAIGMLVGMICHEIRNPLGSIMASSSHLRKLHANTGGVTVEIVDRIERNINRCDSHIKAMQRLRDPIASSLETVSVDQWLEETVNNYDIPHTTALKLIGNAKCKCLIDSELLAMCLNNLLINAIQSIESRRISYVTEKPQGLIELRSEADACNVRIWITDNGLGISSEQQEKIFKPFHSTKVYGFGLGLSLVKRVLEAMDADIRYHPSEQGAVFCLEIPRVK